MRHGTALVLAGVCIFALAFGASPWWIAIALVAAAVAWASVAVARWASRRGWRARAAVLIAPLPLYGLSLVALHFAPTCQDWLDGPCEWNRMSDLAVLLFGAAVLASAPAVAVLFAGVIGALGRQDGSTPRVS